MTNNSLATETLTAGINLPTDKKVGLKRKKPQSPVLKKDSQSQNKR